MKKLSTTILRTFPVLAALSIASLVGADASAAATKKPAPRPVGSVKLPSAKIKRVVDMGGFPVRCGNPVGKAWQSGSVLKGGYFIADSQQVKNYTLAAKKLKNKKTKAAKQKRAKYLKRAKYFKVLVSAGRGPCNAPASTPTPPPTPPPTDPTPTNALRFSIANKSGLALKSGAQGSSARSRPGAHTATVGSNLQAIAPDGAITDAVASGVAAVSRFLIAPNGKVYVLFSSRTNLADTASPGGESCLLAEVNAASGLPVCIDSTLQYITWDQTSSSANPPIQFDAAGSIYYIGRQVSGNTVLRRYRDGAITDLVNDNIYINKFLILPDGSLIISGTTTSTQVSWTRRLDAGGSLGTLLPTSATSLYRYSDGNVYIGSASTGYFGIFRFLTGTSLMDPLPWTTAYQGPSHIDTRLACEEADRTARQGFCSQLGSSSLAHFGTTDNKDFIIAGWPGTTNLVQLYPTLSFPTTTVKNISVAQQVVTSLILAGTNSSAKNIMTLYNTSNDVETPLLGADNEIEIYHVNFAAGENKVLFDGLRFSDNKYVLGQVDLATREASVTTTIAAKWADFQTFR